MFLEWATFPDSSQKFRHILYSTELHVRFYVATSHFNPFTMVTLATAGGPIQSPLPSPTPHKPPESSQQHFVPIIQAISLQRRPAGTRNNLGTQPYVDQHDPNADHTPSPAAVTVAASIHPPLSPAPLITLSTHDRRRIVRLSQDPFRSQTIRSSSIRQAVVNTTHMPHGTTATTTTHTSQQYIKKKKNDSMFLKRFTASTIATTPSSPHSPTAPTRYPEARTHPAQADQRPIQKHSPTHRQIVRNTALHQNYLRDPNHRAHSRPPQTTANTHKRTNSIYRR